MRTVKTMGREHVRGGFNYVTVLLLLFLGAVAVGCWCYVPPIYGEMTLKRAIEAQMIKASQVSDQEMLAEINKVAERAKISLAGDGAITINRFNNEIKVMYRYQRTLPLSFLPPYKVDKTLTREITQVQTLFHKTPPKP